MLNLVKMYMRKMMKSRSTYVLLIIAVLFSLITLFSMQQEEKYYKEHPEAYAADQAMQQEMEGDDAVTVGYTAGTATNQETTLAELADGTFPGMLPCLLLAIFVVIFVCSEHSTGFVKNISGLVPNRGKLFLAKIPTIVVFTLLIMGVSLLGLLLPFRPMMGYFHLGDGSEFAKMMALQVMIYVVFAILVAAIATVIRGTAVSMTIGVTLTSGMFGLIYALITMALRYLFDISGSFQLSNYTVSGTIPQLSMGLKDSVMTRGITVGIIYLIVSIVAAYCINRKRDV